MKVASYLFLLAIFSLSPQRARAEVWIKPEFGSQSGTTDFELRLEQQRPDGSDVKVRSLLEWPVDFLLAGAELGTSIPAARVFDAWLIEARVLTNLGDARGKMADSDWISSRSRGVKPTLFAYTESETRSFALLSDLSLGYRFGHMLQSHGLTVDVRAGSRLEYYGLTAMGAEGKYLDQDGGVNNVQIDDDVKAAKYSVFHVLPFVGSRVVFQPWPNLSFPVLARVHALLSYSHDDHVLRNKDAYGRAYGVGFSGSAGVEYKTFGPLSLGASAEAYYLESATGVLKQSFYADDPGTSGDERNSVVPNSDFDVKSARLQVMVFARLSF